MHEQEEQRRQTNWSQVAAWTFGAWALLVPLSASIIVTYQQRSIDRQEQIQTQIAALRAEFLKVNADVMIEVAKVNAEHEDIKRRVDRIERVRDGHE
jgi:hypothetical protein